MSRRSRQITFAEAMDHGHAREIAKREKSGLDEHITFTDGSTVEVIFRPGHGGGCDTCGYGADEGDVTFYLTERERLADLVQGCGPNSAEWLRQEVDRASLSEQEDEPDSA